MMAMIFIVQFVWKSSKPAPGSCVWCVATFFILSAITTTLCVPQPPISRGISACVQTAEEPVVSSLDTDLSPCHAHRLRRARLQHPPLHVRGPHVVLRSLQPRSGRFRQAHETEAVWVPQAKQHQAMKPHMRRGHFLGFQPQCLSPQATTMPQRSFPPAT